MNKLRNASPSNHKAFRLALQGLLLMSRNNHHCPSRDIASNLSSEATLIRRIMAKLAQENILETREGRDGGYRLKLPPESITCADVYLALQTDETLCEGMLDTSADHPLGVHLNDFMSNMEIEIKQCVLDVLRRHTIADLANLGLE